MTYAFVFPGQGSQHVGMGRALAGAFTTAKLLFEEVDDALGQNLTRIMFDGPEDALTLTENCQPALMTVSLALMRVLAKDGGLDLSRTGRFVAGHSLGEYSALAAAGALDVATAARLLKTRGRAMQEAVPVGAGAMAALLGVDLDAARVIAETAAAETGEVCEIANDNAPGQVVVSGERAAVERAAEIAPEHGVRRAVMLSVSAPFHCSLLRPAAEVMAKALADVDLEVPVIPVVANVSAQPVEDTEEIRALLVKQVTGTVRWRESVSAMREAEVGGLVEVGAGKVLSGLARRIDRNLQAWAIETPEEIEAFLKTL